MGGSGGGGQSTTSQKQGPPTWELPYAKQQTGIAQQMYAPGQQYPQQQVAGFTPDQLAAMGLTQDLTGQQQGYLGQAQALNAALAGGTPDIGAGLGALTGIATGQNPALQGAQGAYGGLASGQNPLIQGAQGALSGIASGQNPWMQQAGQAAGGLLNDPSVAAAIAANQNIAQGGMLNAANNPALQSYLQAGMDPIVRNYQQAIAPNILSSAVASGGLGSSGTQNAYDAAQQNLASQLGNYAASVVEPAYQQERGLQQQAIQAAPGLLAPSEQGISALTGLAGQQAGAAQALPGTFNPQLAAASGLTGIAGQQAGAATGIPGMYNPAQQAIGQAAGLSQAQYGPAGQLLDIGQQQQQQQQNILNTIFGNQMMPYQMLTQAANLISPLSGGGGQSFQVSSMPGGSMK